MGNDPVLTRRTRHAIFVGIAIILLAVGLRVFTEAFSVPSSSMEPTLLPGDHLFAVRYLFRHPGRGDVVIFEDESGTTFVKRIIGVPGDSVQLERGRVLVNGEPLNEVAYAAPSHSEAVSVHVVPKGHFFLLGDNRDHSADSRAFGFVSSDALIGRARFVYWSSTRDTEGMTVRWSRLFRPIE